ncbi:hypothetical protein J4558_18525 [Leptolyngbya sp. 15MV]|nr:hypothetical protein J4558_18525 [Leptolyngbya sp. 15MV]
MKMKGISWIELHVEKIVLATVAVIFLVVLAMQFLWQPNRIKVGQGEPLPPGRAFEPAIQRAQQIEAAMRRTELPAEAPPPVSATLVEDFRKAAQSSLAPAPRLARLGPGLAITAPDGIVSTAIISGVAAPVGQVVVPAPSGLIAHAYRGTIDPMEAVGNRELAALLPAQQPFDKIGVSVQARFDGVALRAARATACCVPSSSRRRPGRRAPRVRAGAAWSACRSPRSSTTR